ncbi:hypothetical protein MD484_g5660, partial [Candolleomyces efflorescens]
MPKDTRPPLPNTPPTPESPYSSAQLRRSDRLRQNTNVPSGSPSSSGSSEPPAPRSTPFASQSQWAPPTPSTPRVIRTYSRASKKKHSKIQRELSVNSTDSDDLPTALEFLEQIRRSSAQPLDDAVVIKEFLASVESSGTCTICMLPMTRPYITSCGHGWCANCLKTTFQAQLAEKLLDLVLVNHHFLNHTLVECQHVPTCDFEQHLLVRALKEHDCNMEELFSYTCPECRALIRTEPVLQPLVDLLKAEQCSIPRVVEKLDIRIRDATPHPQGRRAIRKITWRINFILQHIVARSYVTIDLEWMINAYPGWITEYFVPSSLRLTCLGSALSQLIIGGHLSRLRDLTAAISQLRSLVLLKVSALWKDDGIPAGGYLSPDLQELEVNTASLCVLGWINSLPLLQPRKSLRVFKIEAKHEFIQDFSYLDTFVQRFGSCLVHVSFRMFPRAALKATHHAIELSFAPPPMELKPQL